MTGIGLNAALPPPDYWLTFFNNVNTLPPKSRAMGNAMKKIADDLFASNVASADLSAALRGLLFARDLCVRADAVV
jgi:hypothetical protein